VVDFRKSKNERQKSGFGLKKGFATSPPLENTLQPSALHSVIIYFSKTNESVSARERTHSFSRSRSHTRTHTHIHNHTPGNPAIQQVATNVQLPRGLQTSSCSCQALPTSCLISACQHTDPNSVRCRTFHLRTPGSRLDSFPDGHTRPPGTIPETH
jgi:hypothetical protein